MLPQIGPGTFAPAPLAPTATARSEQGAPPGAGEVAAARIRPETAERVDPPRPPLAHTARPRTECEDGDAIEEAGAER